MEAPRGSRAGGDKGAGVERNPLDSRRAADPGGAAWPGGASALLARRLPLLRENGSRFARAGRALSRTGSGGGGGAPPQVGGIPGPREGGAGREGAGVQ